MAVSDHPKLENIQHGYSGRCSACGDVLMTQNYGVETHTPEDVRKKLEAIFAAHVVQRHQQAAPSPQLLHDVRRRAAKLPAQG